MYPAEIYHEILLRLPVKSILVCKCVCKTWFSLISNPTFAKSHLHLTMQKDSSPNLIVLGKVMYSISHNSVPSLFSTDLEFLEYAVEIDYPLKSPDDSVVIMGCCDGLVCLQFWCDDDDMNFFCLWNPATKEFKKLPKSPNGLHNYPSDMIGLGYDRKSDDYKLVIHGLYDVLEVYSLGLNSWTCIENVPYYFIYYQRVGVLVNRDLHWLALAQGSSKIVVCLDFGDDAFKEIQLPNELLVNANDRHISLGALEGHLCLLVQAPNVHSEVWVMQDYGVQASWTKRHIINHEIGNYLSLILFGFLLFDTLVIYDPKTESIRKLNIRSFTQYSLEGWYYESLVSLRSGTYVGREEQEEDEEAMARM